MTNREKHTDVLDVIYQLISSDYYDYLKTITSVDVMRNIIRSKNIPKEYWKDWFGASINYIEGEYFIVHYVSKDVEIKLN